MRIYKTSIAIIFLTIIFISFSSCISTRKIPEGKYLLKSNAVILKDKVNWNKIKKNTDENLSLKSSLLQYAKQKPNRTTLGLFKLNLWIYNIFQTKKMKGRIYWVQKNIGEAPVIFDSIMLYYSAQLMQDFLKTKGYLNAQVTSHYKISGRKATAFYDVNAGNLTTIDTLEFVIGTKVISSLLSQASKSTILNIGSPLDFKKMEEERKRIHKFMLEAGLYRFNANEIYFEVDTPIINYSAKVRVKIDESDSSETQRIYKIKNVFINQNYNPIMNTQVAIADTIEFNKLLFTADKNWLKPKRLFRVIFISPGENYSLRKNDFTINRLADLGAYKFISVQYQPAGSDSLDCIIRLTPNKASNYSNEIKAASIETNIGNSLSVTYLNRNLAKDATRLSINAMAGVEIPVANFDSLLFSISSGIKFSVPRILFPVLHKKVSRYAEQHTNISFTSGALFQTGIYSLYNQNFSFAYDFREPVKELKRHQPGISLTYTRPIILSDSFRARLNSDFLLKQTFSDQLITGCNYTFTYSNQVIDKLKNFFFMRTGFELAGGLLWLLNDGTHLIKFKSTEDNTQSLILDIPYSNYLRLEFDCKYYWLFTRHSNFIAHFFTGVGLPFSNSSVLPYIRQFAVGGPNDIRAWRVRSLGPGSSVANQLNGFYNQTGDLKLEGNLEYRFKIAGVFKGAIFSDAGNIWLLNKNIENTGAEFNVNRFYKEIAVGAGVGLRMDFSYFIFRGDVAMPLRNPALTESERWLFSSIDFADSNWRKNNLILNIAIGYPF